MIDFGYRPFLLGYHRLDILIGNFFFLIRQIFKSLESPVQVIFIQSYNPAQPVFL